MSYLEDDLKAALRRVEAPPDFTERVLERLASPSTPNRKAAPQAPKRNWWAELALLLRPPRVQWVALSVIASLVIPMVGIHEREQRRMEGEMAKQQLVYAVRLAGSKLHQVQKKVFEINQTDRRL